RGRSRRSRAHGRPGARRGSPRSMRPATRRMRAGGRALAATLALSLGCAARTLPGDLRPGPFRFPADIFAFANETVWEYGLDPATDLRSLRRREPRPPLFAPLRHDAARPPAVLDRLALRPLTVPDPRVPELTIDHLVLVFDAEETPAEIRFLTYDPNDAAHPVVLTFDRAADSFSYAPTPYFPGDPVKAYEVYDGLLY